MGSPDDADTIGVNVPVTNAKAWTNQSFLRTLLTMRLGTITDDSTLHAIVAASKDDQRRELLNGETDQPFGAFGDAIASTSKTHVIRVANQCLNCREK